MLSKEKIVKQGNWLFRWRSYLPLLLLFVIIPLLWNFHYLYDTHLFDLIWEGFCLGLSIFGLCIRCYTIGYVPRGTSGRNTRGQLAETLNTTGIYSLVRNPLYIGNFFMMFGVILFLHNIMLTFIFLILFGIYYERIVLAEEEFLLQQFGQKYVDYANRTSAFFPSWKHWCPPDLPFSWRTVLKKEYYGLLGMTASFFTLETVTDALIHRYFVIDRFWLSLLIFAIAAFVILRTLKKHSSLLDVDGR